jgi:hypothetical protein
MPLGGGTEFFEELSRVATAIAVGEDEHRTVELGFTVRIEK